MLAFLIEKPSKRFVMAANYKVIIIGFLVPAIIFIAIAQTININKGFSGQIPAVCLYQNRRLIHMRM